MRPRLFNLRAPSLPRGNLIVALSLAAALLIAHPPQLRTTVWLALPVLTSMWGSAETARCLRRTWSWYHGGVLMLLYADLMVATLLVFLLVYPYILHLDRVR